MKPWSRSVLWAALAGSLFTACGGSARDERTTAAGGAGGASGAGKPSEAEGGSSGEGPSTAGARDEGNAGESGAGGLVGAAGDEASGEGGAAGAPVRFECPTSGGSIVLPDPALDAEVRGALALIDEPITAELARQLEVLNFVHLGLHSLAGLECFP
ncbi:MAG: hypothetical protein ABIQ16_06420 [Polyangiaceae bacterium]